MSWVQPQVDFSLFVSLLFSVLNLISQLYWCLCNRTSFLQKWKVLFCMWNMELLLLMVMVYCTKQFNINFFTKKKKLHFSIYSKISFCSVKYVSICLVCCVCYLFVRRTLTTAGFRCWQLKTTYFDVKFCKFKALEEQIHLVFFTILLSEQMIVKWSPDWVLYSDLGS